MTDLTYLELFAGVGGMSLGFDRAGFRCVGHAEIEKFPRRVLSHRWPDTPLFGDVCELTGDQVERPTIVTFGAPCQDLSVAGKRAGLAGSRSSLFYEGIRLWHETQATYALYENVLGALSSNKGGDFALVLSAFVGSPVAVPADGWRGGGGVVCGRAGVAAWRVLDAQFFGVPQRRRRVFVLGTRTGGVDPAEVLALSEGLSGDTPSRRETREGTAADAGTGIEGGVQVAENSGHAKWTQATSDGCLRVAKAAEQHIAFHATRTPVSGSEAPRLGASAQIGVVAFDGYNQKASAVYHQLRTQADGGDCDHAVPAPAVYDARGNGDAKVVSTLAGDHGNRVTDYTPIVFRKQAHGQFADDGTSSAQKGRDHKEAKDIAVEANGRPRRLMPLECERLMGWPDNWTNVPDEKGKPASDSARYKACGNGVATPVAHWIALRLREAIESVERKECAA